MAQYDYIGTGEIWLTKRAGGTPRMIGNCSKLSVAVSEAEKSLPNYMSCEGGYLNTVSRIDAVNVSITAHDFSPENLALALYGTATTATGSTVTDESRAVVAVGTPIETIYPAASITSVKEGASTLVLGTDYTVDAQNRVVPKSGGALLAGDTVLITYARAAGATIEALVHHGDEYSLEFKGMNQAHGCRNITVKIHRVKFAPTGGLDFIGDDFGSFELAGKALVDTTITTAGLSKYMQITLPTA